MLFNSALFLLLFFPIVTLLYYALPQSRRWQVLLVASCYFYAVAIPAYLLVLFAVIAIDFAAALAIMRSAGRRRKAVLIVSLASNLTLLGLFKYADFLGGNVNRLASLIGWNYSIEALAWVLPIGLSFHTFQSMAYTIEVYRGRYPAERHAGIFALYVMFYPQLVAGPIERPEHLLPQLRRPSQLSANGLRGWWRGLLEPCILTGAQWMLLGLFKKMVIADRMALVVDPIYGDPRLHGAAALLVATMCFAIQIYCDFSGYTHIARGAAMTMGVDLTRNFNHPYGARSVDEFWRRWHISLSSWFRDYVYIPLGGNRVSLPIWVRNVMVTFLLSGLWHGANWTFVIWGALHGAFIVMGRLSQRFRTAVVRATHLDAAPLLHDALRVAITFTLVTVAWVFFRAESLDDARFVINTIVTGAPSSLASLLSGEGGLFVRLGLAGLPLAKHEWLITFGLMAAVLIFEQRRSAEPLVTALTARPAWLRYATVYALILGVLFFGIYRTATFIYFQF